MLDDLDLTGIPDERARALIVRLLNLSEDLSADLRAAQAEIQRLRDENNRLNGEQGKPTITPNAVPPDPTDHSSERERRPPTERVKRGKRATSTLDREQTLRLARATRPPDAEFKGDADVVVQDRIIRTDNILFHKEVFSAPAAGQRDRARLPRGDSGAFGPGVNALSLVRYFGCLMSEAKIRELFVNVGLPIAAGTSAHLRIKDHAPVHAEKDAG